MSRIIRHRDIKTKMSKEETYQFLMDVNNYFDVIPKDWDRFHVVDKTTFAMGMKGLAPVAFEIVGSIENKKVVIKTASYIDCTITFYLEDDTKGTEVIMDVDLSNVSGYLKIFMPRRIKRFVKEVQKNLKKAGK